MSDEVIEHACLRYDYEDEPSQRRHARHRWAEDPSLSRSSLYAACALGDVDAVRSALKAGDANALGGPRDWPPLMYLAYSRVVQPDAALEIARALLDAGADPSAWAMIGDCRFSVVTGLFGEGELGLRCQPPHPARDALLELVFERGASVVDGQSLYNTGFTADPFPLTTLLARGLDASHDVDWGQGPTGNKLLDFALEAAVMNGHEEKARLALEAGADVDCKAYFQPWKLVEVAQRDGLTAIVELLEAQGATSVVLDDDAAFRAALLAGDGATARRLRGDRGVPDEALHVAAERGWDDAVALMLELDADATVATEDGVTALHLAAGGGHQRVVERLVAAGCDVSKRDRRYGGSPTGWAYHSGAVVTQDWLGERSEDPVDLVRHASLERIAERIAADPQLVDFRTPAGNGLLHVLNDERVDPEAVVDLLLAAGVDPTRENDAGLEAVERLEADLRSYRSAAHLRAASSRNR